jgi:hypothetical protein
LLWPTAYTLLLMFVARHLFASRRVPSSAEQPLHRATDAFLLAHLVIGFCLWMLIFSVERYLVVLEMLLPLATWLLLHQLFGRTTARRIGVTLMLAACVLSIGRFETWGNARFSDTIYTAAAPAIADPAHTTIVVLTAPVAWMFTQWSSELAYVSLNSTMPESPAYQARVRDIVMRRDGPVYALVASAKVDENSGMARLNRWLSAHDVQETDLVCGLAWLNFTHAPSTDIFFDDRNASSESDRPCRFRRDSAKYGADLGDDQALANAAARSIAALGYVIDVSRCERFTSSIGDKTFANQLCPVQMR